MNNLDSTGTDVGGLRRTVLVVAAAAAALVAVAFAIIGGGGVAVAATPGGNTPGVSLTCERSHSLVGCTLITDRDLDLDEGVQFSISIGGQTQTITATSETNPVFRPNSHCGNSDGACYVFSFTPEQSDSDSGSGEDVQVSDVTAIVSPSSNPPTAVSIASAVSPTDQSGQQPQADSPTDQAPTDQALQADAAAGGSKWDTPVVTCTAPCNAPDGDVPQPTGDDVVEVSYDGSQISISDSEDTSTHVAPIYPTTLDEVDQVNTWTQEVEDEVDEKHVVIHSPGTIRGDPDHEANWENQRKTEEALQARGRPYTVCFPSITFTNKHGEEMTTVAGCVLVTPD